MGKRTIAIIVALLLAMTLVVGCSNSKAPEENQGAENQQNQEQPSSTEGSTTEPSGEALKVGHIFFNAAAAAEGATDKAFKDYVKEKGYNWEITDVDAKTSPEALTRYIEDYVNKQVDVIYISYADLRAAKSALEVANKAGIPVFTVDSGWTPGVVADVTSNNYVMSGKVSTYMIDKLGGKGNIVVFGLDPIQACRKRADAINAVLKEYPGIKVLGTHNISLSNFYEDTQKAMENFLNKYGDQIDAVWTPFDEAAMAVSDAIEAGGKSKKDLFVTGFDGHRMALDRMSKGGPQVATAGQGFEAYGPKIGELIQKIVVEKTPAEEILKSRTIYVETPLITEFNIPEAGTPAYQATDFYSVN